MATSIFLAQLIGPVAVAGAVGIFLNASAFRAMAQEFLRSPAMIYLSGLLTMTAGLSVVLNHNLWVTDWRILLTIFGWLATIGGAARIALPQKVKAIGEAMLDKPIAMTVGGSVWLVIGVLLCFFGYFR
jgi:hypothetical protein